MSGRISHSQLIVMKRGTYCLMSWSMGPRNLCLAGNWFVHECGEGPNHDGRHRCEHDGCRSWRKQRVDDPKWNMERGNP